MATQDELRAQARALAPQLEKAGAIAKLAADANRAMTRDERATYDAAMAQAEPVLSQLKAHRNVGNFTAAVSELSALGATGTKSGQRISFKNMAAGISNRMITGEFGHKSLAPSGAAVVTQGFVEDPVALGRVATGLLDLLPVQVQSTSEYSFLSQSVRTNNAAVVADGAVKPTSVVSLVRVEQSLSVIAHLSEGIPRYWVTDNGSLERFVNSELEFGLLRAVEEKVIADINATSGIQTMEWSLSIAETLRRSMTLLEIAGLTPAAILLHPNDFETVELAVSTTNAIEHVGLPYDAAQRRLFGVPIATSVSATAGVGHVLAADAVVLDTDAQGVQILWSETSNADDFSKNLIRCRVEGRYGTSVLAPLGVVEAELDAGS